MKSARLAFFTVLLGILSFSTAFATHMHGTEAWYEYKGADRYLIHFRIYQDYLSGDVNAIREDDPLFVSIFAGSVVKDSMIIRSSGGSVPLFSAGPRGCVTGRTGTDTRYVEFTETVSLPASPSGYTIKIARCCIANNIDNIEGSGTQGLEASIHIPGTAAGNSAPVNSSPRFNSFPTIQACINTSTRMDFSATDADSDSLVYRFETPFAGGQPNNAKPVPASVISKAVSFKAGFSHLKPFGDAGNWSIDPQTGVVTLFSGNQGKYMLAVACDEYRGGIRLGTIQRNIVVLVSNCVYEVKAAVAADSAAMFSGIADLQYARCGGMTQVAFKNASTGGQRYRWDFGDEATVADTSTEANPTYTYPGPGKYLATLVAHGSSCSDTLRFQVWIAADGVQQDFDLTGGPCERNLYYLTDYSILAPGMAAKYVWQTSNSSYIGKDIEFVFGARGVQAVRGVVITDSGCVAYKRKEIRVGSIDVHIESDTTVALNRQIRLLATGAATYEWVPNPYAASVLNEAELLMQMNGVVSRYPVVVTGSTPDGCSSSDTAYVSATERGYYFIPTGFTPNGDGRNDVLTPMIVDYRLEHFAVYNRRGIRLFSTDVHGHGWDGTYAGVPQDLGVYYWMLRIRSADGHMSTVSGETTLIR